MRDLTQISGLIVAMMVLSFAYSIHAQQAGAKEVRGTPIKGQPIKKAAKASSAPAAATEAKTSVSEGSKSSAMIGEFRVVDFASLANFNFEVPQGIVSSNAAGKSNEQIPADVRALNQKKVALTGFMLPLKVDNGLVSEMLIMKDQSMCCYGAQPRINDWVSVKMSGRGVKSVMDQPVTVYGQMRVGEMLENGYLIGIYEMTGEKMDVSQE